MKVLYITNAIHGSGGLERVLSLKANYLLERHDYEVFVVSINSENVKHFYNFNAAVKFYNINVKGNPINYFIKYKKGIRKVIKSINPDVISVCDDGLKGLLVPLIFGKKTPVIYERHASVNLNFGDKNRTSFLQIIKKYLTHKLMIFGAKKFDAFVILTRGNKDDWPGVKCSVIPNPISFENEDVSKNNSQKIVLAVGSQSYNKGYDRLIDIWSIVSKKHLDWKLEIFGKIDESLNLQRHIEALGLDTSISFNKPVKNIVQQYKKASIFALTSRSEGFGMVLIEAMSFGVPCISFNCPHGPADIIKDGEDGFLIENGEIQEFAKSIIRLIEDAELRNSLGANAIENVKRYSPDTIIPIWDKLFKSLVK